MSISDDQLMEKQDEVADRMHTDLRQSVEEFKQLHAQVAQQYGENFAGEAAMTCLTWFRRAKDLDRCLQIHAVVPAWPKALIDLACEIGRTDCLPSLLEQMEGLGVSDLGSAMATAGLYNQRAVIDFLWERSTPAARSRALVWSIIKGHQELQTYVRDKGARVQLENDGEATKINASNLLEFGSASQIAPWLSWDVLCEMEIHQPPRRSSQAWFKNLTQTKALVQARQLHQEIAQEHQGHSSRPIKKL